MNGGRPRAGVPRDNAGMPEEMVERVRRGYEVFNRDGVVEMDWAQLLSLHDGAVVRIENYTDRAKAREAAGLSQ